MPQLDIATYSSQIFWLIICLGFLYICLRYIFVPRLESSIRNRQRRIEKMLLEAEKMQAEAEGLNKQYLENIQKTHREAAVIQKNALAEFNQKCKLQLEELAKKNEENFVSIFHDIDKARKELMAKVDSASDSLLEQYVAKAFEENKSAKNKINNE